MYYDYMFDLQYYHLCPSNQVSCSPYASNYVLMMHDIINKCFIFEPQLITKMHRKDQVYIKLPSD